MKTRQTLYERYLHPICSALRRWLRKEWHNFWNKDQAMCGRCGHVEQANGASWRWHGVTCHFPDQCPECGWPNARISDREPETLQ